MDLSFIVSAIGISAVCAVLIYLMQSIWKELEKRKGKELTLQDRISKLTKNLESSVAVITEIETEISKRKNLAQQLETDIGRYNKLKEINKAQVEAIAQTLKIPLLKESRKSWIINALVAFVVALIFFLVGHFFHW